MTNNRLKSLCLSFYKISINNKALPRTNIATEILRQTITISPRLWSWRLRGWGGGNTSLYKPYRYVRPQRVGILRRFDLNLGIDFAHFGLES